MSSGSDTEGTSAGQNSEDPPGAVSNQNQEEAEGAHTGSGPSVRGHDDAGARPDEEREGDAPPGTSGDSAPGSATEGSQATGHPENAG